MADLQEEAFAYLLGGDTVAVQDVLRTVGAAVGAPGILRRLIETYQGDPVGPGQQIDVGAAVKALTVPNLALSCVVSVEVQAIRLTVDGTPPTAGVGLLIPAGTVFALTGRATMQAAQIIGAVAGAFVDVAYWS